MPLEKITFGDGLPGYFSGSKGAPAVVVLQEWWGITDEVKAQADYIARSTGASVLIPDIYKGKVGVNAEEASHLMNNLDFQNAVSEIGEAVKDLKSEGAPKVGAVGFCMGGSLALLAAEHAGVDAAVSFYGFPPAEAGHPDKIQVPIQGHIGSEDSFFKPSEMQQFFDTAQGAGTSATLFTYPGEGHAFMNGETKDILDRMKTGGLPMPKEPEHQKTAWLRTFEFLKETIDVPHILPRA